ncbi:hypothetical protein GGS23DRAFT_605263 [Durotheca rogersii]|uniref:uncharacterized protein n=1 Tax=Durotheca rogersii TaxID=419775 RepID=UPI00221F572F|nr:uncharacterized protein GGS23DRAFT_605263 [Durotheca rogersii]KAI5863233.1 hypothetical protein GGS23DRAFT_605263 [Durotheca rogersii]
MATNGNLNHTDQSLAGPTIVAPSTAAQTIEQSGGAGSNSNLGKDEVAWFFVEQYYTTLSKNPEKLHLFYSKRSQFVYGLEAEVANVSVGRQNIQDRIKQLDLQDCKVRVSNVDSQASYDNIVIQVIGETSNKAGDPKKFVQTFVLAQQPSGYFVLNDILRYIDEEGEEEPAELTQDEQVESKVPVVSEAKEDLEVSSTEPAETPVSSGTDVADKKPEEVIIPAAEDVAPANGEVSTDTFDTDVTVVPEAVKQPETESVPDVEPKPEEPAPEEAKEVEKLVEPAPTPVQTRPSPAPVAAPVAAPVPAQPPKPMTWASRAAAAAPRPVVPLAAAKTPTPAAAPPTRPIPVAAPQPAVSQAPAPAQAPETQTPAAPAKDPSAEWQTAGSDSKRQNRPQSVSGPQLEKESTMGYVKYVTEKVKYDDLKAALAQHGELLYFDINRSKNCAFVEFATVAGYQAAAAASPHVVNGENIVVEPRRPKAAAYGGSNYTAGRGNGQNRSGRGGFEGRTGNQNGRANYGGQGRGRVGGAPRGRGASQAANA